MTKIGITGQAGFIGNHLYNTLNLEKNKYQVVEFRREFFYDNETLDKFVAQCDVIVHLAGVNRHDSADVIYHRNIELAVKLKDALIRTKSSAHIIFSSSTQEERDNEYGKAKKEARRIFAEASVGNNFKFTGLIIPNVFGPFGNPYYNSVIATFCHQLTHQEEPEIHADGELRLIFIAELIDVIVGSFNNDQITEKVVDHTCQIKVSEILALLRNFKQEYFEKGVIPAIKNKFELNLFNTFRSYIDINSFYPFSLKKNTDVRGTFVELIRLNTGGQVSFSTTLPGITRGNHFHTRKIERFAVIKGKAKIELRKIGTSKVFDFYLDGNTPSYVDMPVWFTHNITNVGEDELFTVFWINEFYQADDPDTYMEIV